MIALFFQGDFYGYRRQKYGNVFKTHVMGNPTIRVSGTEDVSTILTNKNNDFILEYPTSVRTLLGEISGATMTNGDVHKLYRRLYLKTFTSQALKRHLVRISEVIQENIKVCLFNEKKTLPITCTGMLVLCISACVCVCLLKGGVIVSEF